MRWFGFGFNAFGQIHVHDKPPGGECMDSVTVVSPTELTSPRCLESGGQIRASWSRRASLYVDVNGCVSLACFGGAVVSSESCGVSVKQSRGCTDAYLSETHLTLAFPDTILTWELQKGQDTPSLSMEAHPESSGSSFALPLVPGGYIGSKAPFYHSLSPQLRAQSLALSSEHAILLTATGAVYTWGLGSHGQLGHGGLTSEEAPRAVEALWGMTMSCVATGGWHSVCISDGGDLYVWGWNESGQLGLPSRGLMKSSEQQNNQQAAAPCHKVSTFPCEEQEEAGKPGDVFISIQAFPALLDLTPACEVRAVSCGQRHTAAVTTIGDLYTWGWGEYGQLGHQTVLSSDEPQCVEFFRQQQMHVVDVVCGAWNTFAAVVKEEVAGTNIM